LTVFGKKERKITDTTVLGTDPTMVT